MGRAVAPSPKLTDADKRILALLSKIIIENLDGVADNRSSDMLTLTDAQAGELLRLLEQLMQSETFLRKLSFVNLIVDASPDDPKLDLKLVRLTGKRPIAAGIGMTSETMRKWRVRLGVCPPIGPKDPAPMTFGHFLKMEERLLAALDVDPRVADLVLRVAARSEYALRELLLAISGGILDEAKSPRVLRLGALKRMFVPLLSDTHIRELPRERVGALFMAISDMSVMFTTRDWGVAGTMSNICAGLAMYNVHK